MDVNIIYYGIGSFIGEDAQYNVVLPELDSKYTYRLDEVYDFTGSWYPNTNILVLMMSVDGMAPDINLSDFNSNGYDPKKVILEPFTFKLNKSSIKIIPSELVPEDETYTRYDENAYDFTVIVYHDDDAADIRLKDAIKDLIGHIKKGKTQPKAAGFGTLKKI